MSQDTTILKVENLHVAFDIEGKSYLAVEDVSFSLLKGQVLGLVGESGCGKSVTALSLMGLIQKPGRIIKGTILFEDKNLLQLPESELRKIRGRRISIIFQEPMTALNPVFTVGDQIEEVIRIHCPDISPEEAKKRVIQMLEKVGIPEPHKRFHEYPHQLSGGMRQRVMIAMAMILEPALLIADEPTTALDVTIQAQILDLMRALIKEKQTSLILITHDLGVVAEMCDHVAVMYAGKIVESGPTWDIFESPKHPYTQGLIRSVARLQDWKTLKRLPTIPGNVPSLKEFGSGCRFQTRCAKAITACHQQPPMVTIGNQNVACWLYEGNTAKGAEL